MMKIKVKSAVVRSITEDEQRIVNDESRRTGTTRSIQCDCGHQAIDLWYHELCCDHCKEYYWDISGQGHYIQYSQQQAVRNAVKAAIPSYGTPEFSEIFGNFEGKVVEFDTVGLRITPLSDDTAGAELVIVHKVLDRGFFSYAIESPVSDSQVDDEDWETSGYYVDEVVHMLHASHRKKFVDIAKGALAESRILYEAQ